MFNRMPARPSRLALVIALLVLTLGVAVALAWQAHLAARSHIAVAERVQRDYVEFAGWEFSRAARVEVNARLDRWLQVIACAVESRALPDPSGLSTGDGCRCDDLQPRTLFRFDLRDGGAQATGDPLGPLALGWIRRVANGDIRIPPGHRAHALTAGRSDDGPRLIAATYARDRFGAPTAVVGFVADPAVLAPAFKHVIEHTPLLPPTLAGTRNDLLGVSVRTRDGEQVYTLRDSAGGARMEGTFDEGLGGLQYEVSLQPEAAARLVIGGLPRSRLPVLLGLLTLTAGLLGVAVLQLRREYEMSRVRADFVASVSHELRTPLAQIRLFSETLLLGRVRSESEGRRSLEIIQQESRRLTHLVENVLYFSRTERGGQHLTAAPARLATIVEELIEAFAPLARSGRSQLQLQVKADVEAPVDAGALRQILLNLLDNAVKYGRTDQTITVGIDRCDDRAVITVDDQGPGVPEEARTRIWQPYSRLASAAASAVAGTGIGLAVVRHLVNLHGGSSRVEDAPGGGARFVIELPNAASVPAVASASAHHSRVPA